MYETNKFDNSAPGISEITNVHDSIKVEHVEVVGIDHSYRSDLEIILTSPSGTSVLKSTRIVEIIGIIGCLPQSITGMRIVLEIGR